MKRPVLASLTLAVMLMFCAGAMAQRVTVTVAGNGLAGYTGDNGPAKRASLSQPNDVWIDGARNLYFSDQMGGTRIRKLTASTGIISTIAGGGTSVAEGVDATLSSVAITFMAVDAPGNVYYTQGSMVRKIDATTNIVHTIAGAGISSADGVPAVTALFPALRGITVDHLGNVFVLAGSMVKKIEATTGLVYTIAGSPTLTGFTGDGGPAAAALLYLPKYITCDHAGNIYFGDQNAGVSFSDVIRRIDAGTGIITKVIGGGGTLFSCSGFMCMVGGLSGLCCDANDDVIFNEWSCSCRKWDHETNWVTNVAGNFYIEAFKNDTTSDFAYMDHNYGVCSDDDNNYYIADRNNNRIRKVMLLTHAPVFAFGEAQSTKACTMDPIIIDSLLWVADMDASEIETWSVSTPPSGGTLSGFTTTAVSNGLTKTTKPTGLTYAPASGFSGTDMFEVQVSDGMYSDIIKVYVQVGGTPTISGPDDVCISVPVLMVPSIVGGTWGVSTTAASITPSGVLIGSTPGSATVVYTVNNGCAVVAAYKDVNIEPVPDAGTISGAGTLCSGADILLTTTGTDGVWTASNTNVSVTGGMVHGLVGGSVIINYTVTNACGTSTASMPLTVIPTPDAGVITGVDEVCTKSTITLAATGMTGGMWTADNTNVTITGPGTIYGEHVGTVTIHYQVMNECGTAEATKTLAVSDCVPSVLPNLAVTTAVNVYPTPAANTLNIKVSALPVNNASINLMDVTGRVVASDVIANNTTKGIDVTQLANGVYTLAISGDNYSYVNKVVVSK